MTETAAAQSPRDEAEIRSDQPTEELQEVLTAGDFGFRHSATITSIALLPNQRQVITTARDATARLWDLETGKEIRRYYHPENDGVWQAVVHPDQTSFFTTNSDGKVRRWEIATGKLLATFDTGSPVMRMAIFPDRHRLIAVGNSGSASVWEIESSERLTRLRPKLDDVYGVDISSDGSRVVTCGEKGAIVWSTAEWTELYELKHDDEDVCTARFSPDGLQVASCDDDGLLRIFDSTTGDLTISASVGRKAKVLDWSHDGKRIAVSDSADGIAVFDTVQQKVVQKFQRGKETFWPVKFSPDGESVLFGASNGLYEFQIEDARTVSAAINEDREDASFARLSPAGIDRASNQLIAADQEFNLFLYDLTDGNSTPIAKTKSDSNSTRKRIAVSVDGAFLAIVRQSGIVDSDVVEEVIAPELLEELDLFIPVDEELNEDTDLSDETVADDEEEQAADRDVEEVEAFKIIMDRSIATADELLVTLYNSTDFSPHRTFALPVGELTGNSSMQFVAGGRKLLVWLTMSRFQVWDVATGKLYWDYQSNDASNERFYDTYASGNSSYVLVGGSSDEKVRVMDIESRMFLGELQLTRDKVGGCCFLRGPRGMLLAEKDAGDEVVVSFWKGRLTENPTQLTNEQMKEQIRLVCAASYAQRESAMDTLIDQGPAILDLLGDLETQDAELDWRVSQIRKEIQRAGFPRKKAEKQIRFDRPVSSITIDPSDSRFALIAGNDANAEICWGTIAADGLRLSGRIMTGHSPESLEFSYDGSLLYSGNRDGSLSVYRIVD